MKAALILSGVLLPGSVFAFDYGPIGNSMFWVVLSLWSFFISYVLYAKRSMLRAMLGAFARSLIPERTTVVHRGAIPPPYAQDIVARVPTHAHVQRHVTPTALPMRVPPPPVVRDSVGHHSAIQRSASSPRPMRREDVRFVAAERSYHEREIIARAERALRRSRNAQEGLDIDHDLKTYDRTEHESYSSERDTHDTHTHTPAIAEVSPELPTEKIHAQPAFIAKKADSPPTPFPKAKSVLQHVKSVKHKMPPEKKESVTPIIAPNTTETFHDSLALEKDENGMPLLVLKRIAQ